MDDARALVDALTWSGHADPMRGAHVYADRVQDAAAVLGVLAEDAPKVAVPLLKLAVNRVTRALTRLDSSSGVAGQGLDQLIRAYARACESAPPAPASLAKWLCALHFEGPGWPDFRLVWFKDALGAKGLALIEQATQERTAAAVGGSFSQEYAVRSFREQLAEASGDVDHYVSVLAEDLRNAHGYNPIVDALLAAGREDDAETWARRGLADTPVGQYTGPLRARLTELLLEAGRGAEAVAENRAAFQAQPSATGYQVLRKTALAAGTWETEHRPALDTLRAKAAHGTPTWAFYLVAILLDEGLEEEAWRYDLKHEDALGAHQRLDLIKLRAVSHPEDVILPYRELIDAKIDDPRDLKWRYKRALTMLKALKTAYRRARGPAGGAEFTAYLATLREAHRRKLSFVKLLDQARFD
jgi:hypothetical protein